ncbi:MAG TPA: AAA family ATPase [bacterium]|nr:AAA family ATPase [bacterium]HPN29865.1 AAA family ATPase [bacterium]
MDQAQKLRAKVNQNKLSALIDDIKNVKDIAEIYNNLISQNQTNSKVFCFISAKGGTGKTLIAYAFADILTKSNKRTAIIDMNKKYSDICSYFQDPELIKVDKASLLENSCFNASSSLIPGKQCVFQISNEIRGVEYQLIKIVMYQARLSNFDYIIIDGPVCSPDFLENISDIADEIWCVSNGDFNSIRNSINLLSQFDSVLNKKFLFNVVFNEFSGDCSKHFQMNFLNEISAKNNLEIKNQLIIEFDKKIKEINGLPRDISSTQFYKTIEEYLRKIYQQTVSQSASKTVFNKIWDKFKTK